MHKILGFTLLGIGISAVLQAGIAPEIDPASGASVLALIAGTVVLIRGRRKK